MFPAHCCAPAKKFRWQMNNTTRYTITPASSPQRRRACGARRNSAHPAQKAAAAGHTHNGTAMPNPVESTSSKPKVSASSSAASAASHNAGCAAGRWVLTSTRSTNFSPLPGSAAPRRLRAVRSFLRLGGFLRCFAACWGKSPHSSAPSRSPPGVRAARRAVSGSRTIRRSSLALSFQCTCLMVSPSRYSRSS